MEYWEWLCGWVYIHVHLIGYRDNMPLHNTHHGPLHGIWCLAMFSCVGDLVRNGMHLRFYPAMNIGEGRAWWVNIYVIRLGEIRIGGFPTLYTDYCMVINRITRKNILTNDQTITIQTMRCALNVEEHLERLAITCNKKVSSPYRFHSYGTQSQPIISRR